MLSFTFQENNTSGIFNGRFVFHAPDIKDMSSYSPMLLELISKGHGNALSNKALRHEYFHWLLFRSSRFGISTIGRRYRARTDFLRGNATSVIDYYKQRTAYFVCSYGTHESIVTELEKGCIGQDVASLSKIKISKAHIEKVRESDEKSRRATEELSALPTYARRLLDYANGFRAALEYGLQCYIIDENHQMVRREISLLSSTGGIFNSAFESEYGSRNPVVLFAKTVRRKLNRERRAGGLTKEMMAKWAILKFSSEHRCIKQLKDNGHEIPAEFEFAAYAHSMADFVHKHTFNDDLIMKKNLCDAILSCGDVELVDKHSSDLADLFKNFDKDTLYFFYVHGN